MPAKRHEFVDQQIEAWVKREKARPFRFTHRPPGVLHPIVQATQDALYRSRPRQAGGTDWKVHSLDGDGPLRFNVRVSTGLISRAISILDVLTGAFQQRGIELQRTTRQHRPKTAWFNAFGFQFEVEMKEQAAKVRIEGQSSFQTFTYCPTGRLELAIGRFGSSPFLIRDDGRCVIEDKLHMAITDVLRSVDNYRRWFARHKTEEAEAEARRQAAAEIETRRAEAREEQRQQEERIAAIFNAAEEWRRQRDLREYIQVVQRLALDHGFDTGHGSVIGDWLARAISITEGFDPLARFRPADGASFE